MITTAITQITAIAVISTVFPDETVSLVEGVAVSVGSDTTISFVELLLVEVVSVVSIVVSTADRKKKNNFSPMAVDWSLYSIHTSS